MKKKLFFITLTLLIGIFLSSSTTDYVKGYDKGWEKGYKSIAGELALVPIVEYEYKDCVLKSDYDCGYDLGYDNGKKKARKDGYRKDTLL